MSKLVSPELAAALIGVTPDRLRQPDMDKRLAPVRIEGGRGNRAYRADSIREEIVRRAKKGSGR